MKRAPLRERTRRMRCPKRGFTLIELAIVLGIVGIVVGGIFVAASAARYRTQLNQASDDIGLITGNMRSLYAGQVASVAPALAFGNTQLIQQGVFPPEIKSPVTGYPDNPWSPNIPGGSVQIQVSPGQFILRFVNVPNDACADLLAQNSTPGPETGLQKVVVGAVSFAGNLNQLPVPLMSATTACTAGVSNTVDWYYTLGN